jgi:hypothetical protein
MIQLNPNGSLTWTDPKSGFQTTVGVLAQDHEKFNDILNRQIAAQATNNAKLSLYNVSLVADQASIDNGQDVKDIPIPVLTSIDDLGNETQAAAVGLPVLKHKTFYVPPVPSGGLTGLIPANSNPPGTDAQSQMIYQIWQMVKTMFNKQFPGA